MTALVRTRGSASELARLFEAPSVPALGWKSTSWIGDPVPAVLVESDRRQLTTVTWGLPERSFASQIAAKQRGTLYPRDLSPSASRLCDPAGFRRCLILIESFAYPGVVEGRCTRTWFGLWDEPLAAWAGVCSPGGHIAGILGRANALVEPYSDTMPLLLAPGDREGWLAGAGFLALSRGYDTTDFYRENLGERWSTGQLDLQTSHGFATAA